MLAGQHDIDVAVRALGERIPPPLAPRALAAYNYRWSWTPDADAVFAAIDPDRWERVGRNPVAQLLSANLVRLHSVAADAEFVARVHALADATAADLARPTAEGWEAVSPVAFLCAEFGVHASLPIYSGGLGVLAGDIVKEASDLALPMVGVGLLYRTGYFHQRIDVSGMQHEYWIEADPTQLPCAPVTDPSTGERITVTVPIGDEDVTVQIWRADVGRVPLYLLDTDRPDNSISGRWITSRLYEGNPEIRLAQYAVLGAGGSRALRAMGIEPRLFHLNEGHPVLAALDHDRDRLVFTTHTPVPAGNETYRPDQIMAVLGRLADETIGRDRLLMLGRVEPENPGESVGMTVLALRSTRSANAVSRRHGEVARGMWQPLFPERAVDDVPIDHVTNGVHVPTWLAPPMRALLDHYLGDGWLRRADDPDTWAPVDDIPDAELWDVRRRLRSDLVAATRVRAAEDFLRRGEERGYVSAVASGLDPDRLTIGFARRLATYKRLYLLSLRADRARALVTGEHPVQFLIAGKAHPLDDAAKGLLRDVFQLKRDPAVAGRMTYLEDYDLTFAAELVSGCDIWVNVPRPPEEASGTSGMKAALNGALQVSVLDGWWAEGYDGENGWAIDGNVDWDHGAQDQRHADALFDLLENEVAPLFHDRGDDGLPHAWLAKVKRSLRTNGPRFSATRMVREYATRVYAR
ncbi:MAG TPA: alpha-glucan family phosphorylase [Acidimicrobiales bacterium]|nr:alpha-glucan family phosphorylase [Acidimicrobiales bacterium]